MPHNKGNNRALDCAVLECIHNVTREAGKKAFDSVRCAFSEGTFLPKPIAVANPHLHAPFLP